MQAIIPRLERSLLHLLLSRLAAQLVGLDAKEAHQAVDCILFLRDLLAEAHHGTLP